MPYDFHLPFNVKKWSVMGDKNNWIYKKDTTLYKFTRDKGKHTEKTSMEL